MSTPKYNIDINLDQLRTWIAALRSGKYSQTRGALQDNTGFCCLGVACRVLIPEDKQTLLDGKFLFGTSPVDQLDAPQWLKDINWNVALRYKNSLIILNDYDNLSFSEIADVLEKLYLSDGNQ